MDARCPECEKAYEKTGGPMGTILPFVNRMAKKFPDKIISTLSYWYSTKPPEGIIPDKNVNILLCNIRSPRHIPVEEGDPIFVSHLDGWTKFTSNIIVWDYVIQFSNLIAPFPNLRTLQPNIQFFKKSNYRMWVCDLSWLGFPTVMVYSPELQQYKFSIS